MEILETQVYRGANYWAPVPAIRFVLDSEGLKESHADMIPGLCRKLAATLPTLDEHRCTIEASGGFFKQVDESTRLPPIAEHVALELQILAGQEVSFGKIHAPKDADDTSPASVPQIIFHH